ncbi:uncharacterized protein LOC128991149 [Macrosteles quadrilineatus]|uniref:uncharacterized protein LOC128991149 n=1 Tax=Macrosteles quadrilineatus TaxID=74068 RepID=UPI0023E24D81|nr:uncharacterized protein LOC128991149 [Macrosteles quadrilineatus]
MEQTLPVLFGILLVLFILTAGISAKAKTNGHVLFTTHHNQIPGFTGRLVQDPDMEMKPKDQRKDSTQYDLPLTKVESKKLLVECEEKEDVGKIENSVAKAFLYSQEGFLVDELMLEYSKDVCKQVKDYISLDEGKFEMKTAGREYDELEFNIEYRFAKEDHKCYKRNYKIITLDYVAILKRDLLTKIECKEGSATGAAGGSTGGIKHLEEDGLYEIWDFIKGSPRNEPIVSSFTDEPGQDFKLTCREYDMNGERSGTMASGLITYQKIVVDRLFLDSCSTKTDGIYIGKMTEEKPRRRNYFAIVFRNKDGQCFSREISKVQRNSYDASYFINRSKPEKVKCRKDWKSGKELNIKGLAWYKKLFKLIKSLLRL